MKTMKREQGMEEKFYVLTYVIKILVELLRKVA